MYLFSVFVLAPSLAELIVSPRIIGHIDTDLLCDIVQLDYLSDRLLCCFAIVQFGYSLALIYLNQAIFLLGYFSTLLLFGLGMDLFESIMFELAYHLASQF